MSSSQIERKIRRSESGFEENALPAWQPYEALQGNTLDVKFGSADFCRHWALAKSQNAQT